jgi:hypothetical protein
MPTTIALVSSAADGKHTRNKVLAVLENPDFIAAAMFVAIGLMVTLGFVVSLPLTDDLAALAFVGP